MTTSRTEAVAAFRDAIQAAGLSTPDAIEADGKLHRFASNGKRGDDAGWYILHTDGIGTGEFGCWRTGLQQSWRAINGRTWTPAEEAAHREKVQAMRREREAEESRRHGEAAKKAAAIWKTARPAPDDHAYLTAKRIRGNGARLHKGALVIPLRDAAGTLHSLQFIGADREKRFLTGGRVAGCYFSIGSLNRANALCIAEGFATGASIHEATGYPTVVAFNAGNLLAVAQAMRAKFPDSPLILCADDDYRSEGNPGITKATEAARAVGGLLAIPTFGEDRPEGATDFNDMAALCGMEAVERAITSVAAATDAATPETGVTEVAGVQPSSDAHSDVTLGEVGEVTGVASESPIPGVTERPAFRVFDTWFEAGGAKHRPGVWFFGIRPGKDDSAPNLTETWVCSPLHVEAVTFDAQDSNFGRLLRFKNTLGRWREWAMPMELLRAAGDELRGELLAMGVQIDPNAHRLLGQYLQALTPKRRMRCTLQVGWCCDSFVLPDAVIGPSGPNVIFQSGERGHDEHARAGTLNGWRSEIAARALGNPLLLLALSAAFAGPLLAKCNAEGGGIHFVGDSSTGKTTAIEAACSVWGGRNFKRSWKATGNGIEGAAALFNDCLLALDEISECDPREIGAIVYAIGNGTGKQRASRTGAARSVTRWRCFVLSSGERTIGTHMAEAGHRARAGQSVRLLDLPAARAFGAWDDLHGATSAAAFSDAIKRAAAAHHGHAGLGFLERLTRDGRDFCAVLEEIKALPMFAADGGEGQDKRAAARFALIGLAGELATEYGLTGWPQGAAIEASKVGFGAWRSLRGRGNDERRRILECVSGFIERHGDGRFSDADATGEGPVIRDRAGWWRDSMGERAYLFTADGMREALKGFDFLRAIDSLQEAGALAAPGANGERARFFRIGGRGMKLYPINHDKLVGGDYVS